MFFKTKTITNFESIFIMFVPFSQLKTIFDLILTYFECRVRQEEFLLLHNIRIISFVLLVLANFAFHNIHKEESFTKTT